ncbi:dethiobiotin synthase [Thalassomonas sp. M1454]|uniref:dethiobiotin synthase n=1 Tax=Thalassomonas sp. M1454 TaxID=2594477 RepID=UPI00117F47AD|nr:dethiobiotin synthase [Thalassomonas sp. M1454]TRX56861.1 dethiobiotin synthase [Thalassomonas sp. M1454]
MKNYFITATDTDAGKTLVAASLTGALVKQGKKVAVYKPISAGCENVDGKLVNGDALELQQQANSKQSIEQINPIAFEEPIAPHIAALTKNAVITCDLINSGFSAITENSADITITEGAGGWRLPLGNGEYLSDFVKQQKLDVILVVHMKLGCLNHAVLTYQSIINDGLNVVAWVANFPEQMPYLQQNIDYLKSEIEAPLIAQIDRVESPQQAMAKFDLSNLSN